MLRNQSELINIIHQAIDIIIVLFCFNVAYKSSFSSVSFQGFSTIEGNFNLLASLAVICFHISLRFFRLYHQNRRYPLKNIILRLFQAVIGAISGIVVFSYLMKLPHIDSRFLSIFFIYCFVALGLFKVFLYKALALGRRNNYNTRSIIVIGSRQRSLDFIKNICRKKQSGYRIKGVLETTDNLHLIGERVYRSVKIIGTLDDFKKILETETIDEVVFGIPLKKIVDVHQYIYFAEEMGKNVRILPDFQIDKIKYYPQTAAIEIEDFLGLPTLALSSTPKNNLELALKSCIDYTGALFGLLLLSPLLLFISVIVRVSSKGPILYRQERSGLNGRRFTVFKFRTMVTNAEQIRQKLLESNEMDGPVFKMRNDPRITPIGRFLRKTSLDELPQLFNVLKGEMSLVGPRPPLPSEVEHYKLWQRRRLSMKPGITCIWQVSGRNDVTFEEWMNMDLTYIDNWSLLLDCKLLLLTIKEVTVAGGR